MNNNAMQMFLTSRIGDGCCTATSNGAFIVYSSILKDYMLYKHKIASAVVACGNVTGSDNSAGFNKKGIIYHFRTHGSNVPFVNGHYLKQESKWVRYTINL